MNNNTHKRKVLIVDDDTDDRNFFVEAMEEIDSSIECVTARDGQQALALLNNPDLSLPGFIFLDLRMPRFNGKQCLLHIKSDTRLKDIPVAIYSTSRGIEDAEELQQLGAVRVISKPADPKEVYYVISVALEEHWSDQP